MTAVSELPELIVTITRQDLVRYAGAANDYLPQHWDQQLMRGQAFPDVVVHGWLGGAHLCRAATDVLSPDRWKLARYAVRYRRPVHPGEVRCGGTVTTSEDGAKQVSGWITDDKGSIVTTAQLEFVARTGPAQD
jgi:acyl dehydratase